VFDNVSNVEIKKTSKLLIITLTIVALGLTASTAAVLSVNQNVSSSGTIATTPNLAVYSDSACTTSMTSISWGSISAGGTATQTVYVKNTGTGTMTLSLGASNWSPSGASSYITTSWNKDGTQLSAGQSVAATITLTVSSNITGITTFSNTIVITGTT
jgi:hypothetical protein